MKTDFVVVGTGLGGLTMAERIASQLRKRVLMIEKRNHIGGNVYDEYDDSHILIQKYGPHTFHTNMTEVYEYLSQFTEWREYQHRVLSYVDGKYIPMPIGIESVNQLYNLNLSTEEFDEYIREKRVPIEEIQSSEDVVLSQAGFDIYEKFFKNFTIKQWGCSPAELDKSVISRIPFRNNRDTRYFTDKYQFQPKHGYTKMCQKMIMNPLISVMLNCDYKEVINMIEYEKLIYTGPIDYYFNYKFGKLLYRSVRMQFESYDVESYQAGASIRFPNDYDYTRITEFKKLTGQQSNKTTILKEYPCFGEEPFYPYPTKEQQEIADQYRNLVQAESNTVFVGRLAEYKYYDMDDVVKRALDCFKEQFL